MRFSRTRLSDVLHAKACAFSRPMFTVATEDVAPATQHRVHDNRRFFCLALAYSFLCSFLVTSRGGQHNGNPLTLGSSVARTKQGPFPRPGLCCPSNSSGTMNPSDSRYGLLRFRFLIRSSRWSPHHRNGSPALGNKSSITCRPCYPGR